MISSGIIALPYAGHCFFCLKHIPAETDAYYCPRLKAVSCSTVDSCFSEVQVNQDASPVIAKLNESNAAPLRHDALEVNGDFALLDRRSREQLIEEKKTPKGGWTWAQLREWGIPIPPPKGWKQQLIDKGFFS